MSEQHQIGANCKACRGVTAYERISPVSRGMDYFRCLGCGTVMHVPKPVEAPR